MNYQEASDKLGNKDKRRLRERNTYLLREDNAFGDIFYVRYHATNILAFLPDGSVKVNNGGWYTVTTKQRLNEYLPYGYRISQRKGQWFISSPSDEFEFENGTNLSDLTPRP